MRTEEEELREVYHEAENHMEQWKQNHAVESGREYIPTFEDSVMVNGIEVEFHIDNSPAIFFDVFEGDDFVYVDDAEVREYEGYTGPYVSCDEFVERVMSRAEEVRDIING